MTETYYTSSIAGDDAFRDARSLKERTVKMRFSSGTAGMFFLNNTNVGEALMQVLPANEILALGCLKGNHEWHCTLASYPGREVLLGAGSITVHSGGSTRVGYCEPLIPTRVEVRVLWSPAWVPHEAIYELLCSLAPVAEFTECRVRVGERAVHNLQYTAVLKDISPANVPDRVTLEVLHDRVPLLLLVKGKPRCCFLCGSCNHTQASCPNPICRYCKKSGHVVGNCPRKNGTQAAPESAESRRDSAEPTRESAEPRREESRQPPRVDPENQRLAPNQGATPIPAQRSHTVATVPETPSEDSKKRRLPEGSDTEEPPSSIRREEVKTDKDVKTVKIDKSGGDANIEEEGSDKVEEQGEEAEEQGEEAEEYSDSMENMTLTPVSDSPAVSPETVSQDIEY